MKTNFLPPDWLKSISGKTNRISLNAAGKFFPALLLLSCSSLTGADAPNIAGQDIKTVAKKTGYTVSEIEKYFPPLKKWPDAEKMFATAPGFAQSRFPASPKPGVHPRVWFTPEQLPEIRRRMNEDKVASFYMRAIRGFCLQLSPDRELCEKTLSNQNLRKNPSIRNEFLKKNIEVGRGVYGYHGPWLGGWYNELAAGKIPDELEKHWDDKPANNPRRYLMHLLPFEAFRALIDQDEAASVKAGKALATIVRRHAENLKKLTATNEWQSVYAILNSQSIGLTYDMTYNHLSPADRDTIRDFITAVTRGKNLLPASHLPAFPGNTTNWLMIHMNILPMLLSVEGEKGFDPVALQSAWEDMKKWVFVTVGPDGAPFEGFTKSLYYAHWPLLWEKHGKKAFSTSFSKNNGGKYNLHMMLPYGGEFVYETGITPVVAGIDCFKYAHPSDPVIDMIYGYTVKDIINRPDDIPVWGNGNLGFLSTRTSYPPSYFVPMVADDPAGVSGKNYNWDETFARTMEHLKKTGEPLSYYSDYRGVMTARSGWDKNALMLYFEPRNVPGGHTHGSRNEFLVFGLGRKWSDRPFNVESESSFHSLIHIDGKGQNGQGVKCPPGKTLRAEDAGSAFIGVGDATWAYSKIFVNNAKGEKVDITPNQSRLHKSPLPWMDLPYSKLPHWFTGKKGELEKMAGHAFWTDYNPVKHAVRSTVLVRGENPYVLVVDDLDKDGKEHLYSFRMMLAPDLVIDKKLNGKSLDITLKEDGPRRCLVRFVEAGGKTPGSQELDSAKTEIFKYKVWGDRVRNALSVDSKSVNGNFITLIYPYLPDYPMPETEFDGEVLKVKFPGKTDEFTLRREAGKPYRVISTKTNGKKVF